MLVGPAADDLQDARGDSVGGQVQVTGGRAAQEDIPDGAADQRQLVALTGEQGAELVGGRGDGGKQAARGCALPRGQRSGVRHGH